MSNSRPLIIGEVLFDQLPDGQRVLGGAPFNVAWNLQGLGLAPLLISAVGQDEPGRIVRERMEGWSLDTSALQVSQNRSTGEVHVELEAGQPSFHILNDQAYDEIQLPDFPISDSEFSLLYHGSLAYRNEPSRSTIGHLISASGLPRFVDINIRQPWFDRAWIPDLLSDAQWIKLSDQELAWITELPCETQSEILKATQELKHRYGGRRCLITCGATGAYAVDEDGNDCFSPAPTPVPMLDAVGAGDAFSAATIRGISQNRPLNELLENAVRFASHACTIPGATTTNRNHYSDFDFPYQHT